MTYGTQSNSRPTIGLVADPGVAASYQATIWTSVLGAAERQNANLFYFSGGLLSSPYGFESQSNIVYDLASAGSMDGIVFFGTLFGFVDEAAIERFIGHYSPLPVVGVGKKIKGHPGVLVDNTHGLRDAITHLAKVHGHRRIAFLRGVEGHPEAEERYQVYQEMLAGLAIPYDPDLVVQGDFRQGSGVRAIRSLLDERQVKVQSIVAANDDMAFGVLEALQERGISVPGEIAVVGFDDVRNAAFALPPLTTVRQPLVDLGERAVEMVLARLAGKPVPEQVTLPTALIVRQSCGCQDPLVVQAAAKAEPARLGGKTFEAAIAAQRQELLSSLAETIGRTSAEQVAPLLDSFITEVQGQTHGLFLTTLDEALRKTVAARGPIAVWHNAISAMRYHMAPYLEGNALQIAENLWGQARVSIGEMGQVAQAHQALETEQQAQVLREIGSALITTFDVTELMDVLADRLPGLNIPSCYLSLYEDPQPYTYPQPAPEWSRLILAYNEGGRVSLEEGGRRFPSHQLVPEGLWPSGRRYSYAVEPLVFRDHQIGFALFEISLRDSSVYLALAGQISSALQGALLLRARQQAEQALQSAYAEVEKQVQARTAELQRETAERARAQEENLHLQQEIIEAQRQALQELSTPIIPVMERIIVMPLIGSIDTLRAKDVMRALLTGIRAHRAQVVIVDITGVPIVDTGVANHLNKTIQAARLKGAYTILTGMSEAVAETIVDLGIDWEGIETMADLQSGLRAALSHLGYQIKGTSKN